MANLFNETIPDVWFKLCPDIQKLQNAILASNVTRAQVQASLQACFVVEFLRLAKLYFFLLVSSMISLAILGLVGSLLTLITLTTTKSVYFQSPTYRYFRVLILVQSTAMLAFAYTSIKQLSGNPDQRVFGWYVVSVYVEPLLTVVFSSWADFIICYLSIERAVACLLPSHFQYLNGKKVFFVIVSATFLVSCISEMPIVGFSTIFYDPQKYAYSTSAPPPAVANLAPKFRGGWIALKTVALVVATSAAIIGFYAAYKRKVRLQLKSSNAQQHIQTEWKVTTQLCILQLAQAIPTIVSNFVSMVSRFAIFPQLNSLINVNNLTYTSGEQVSYTLSFLNLTYCVIEIFIIISFFGHCIHFYMYFICSRPFRAATWEALRCDKIALYLKSAPVTSSVRVHPAAPGSSTGARMSRGSSLPTKRSQHENAPSAATQANVPIQVVEIDMMREMARVDD